VIELPDRSLPAASQDYRARRRALLDAEFDLREHAETVAAQRRALPPGPLVGPYSLTEGPAELADELDTAHTVDLPDLLEPAHDTLAVYHMMFWSDAGCPVCSMWIDGLDGVAAHVAQHLSFAVLAPAPLPQLRQWGRRRGWRRIRLVSTDHTSLGRDFGVDDGHGDQMPAVSVFTRATDPASGEQRLRHRYTAQATLPGNHGRGIDALSPVWNLLDLTPAGRPDWWPGNDYPEQWATGRPLPPPEPGMHGPS
jgi:predicted dithiol-disulfide oxidoreductase (DUF899 family)